MNSGLETILTGHVQGLPVAAQDALAMLAALGTTHLDTARRLVDDDVLELLEVRGHLAVLTAHRDAVAVVRPPLLRAYFSCGASGASRSRRADAITARVGGVEANLAMLAGDALGMWPLDVLDPFFAGLVRERSMARVAVASTEWEATHAPREAVVYVTALADAGDCGADIQRVFEHTETGHGDMEDRAMFIALHASWLANRGGEAAEAFRLLRAERPRMGVFGGILDAAELTLLAHLEEIPSDVGERPDPADDLPVSVQLTLWEAHMLVAVSMCRFDAAHRAFERIQVLDPEGTRKKPPMLHGFALLGQGRHAEALPLLTAWFDHACRSLDIEGIRAFGCALAFCYSHSGDNAALDRLALIAAAVGEPTTFPWNPQISALTVTTRTVSARRGETVLVDRFVSEAQRRGLVDGPLPAQAVAWPAAQLHIIHGMSAEASEELWRSGSALWERRAYYAGMLGLLVAIEVNPSAERLTHVQSLLEEVPENVTLHVQVGYVAALVARDPEALMASAAELAEIGRYGLAVAALTTAEAWFGEAHEHDRAEAARTLSDHVRSRHVEGSFDASRFSPLPAVLSYREEQVARLAAAGYTNREIAAQLYLSVRTVDSHMRRILRKLKLATRHQLGDFLSERGGSVATSPTF